MGSQGSQGSHAVAAFLHYGFVPRLEEDFRERPWARVRPADVAAPGTVSREQLVAQGLERFREACATRDEALHVVPLSGGIDSRFLLATLLRTVPRERIVTVTFGVPGALDFDIAARVARSAGVRHEALDLTGHPVSREELLETARAAPWSFLVEVFYNRLIQRRHGPDAVYWSGCMANAIAGEDLAVHCDGWEDARRVFAARCRVVRTLELTPPGFRPEDALPAGPLLADSCLTPYEQLYAFVRYPGRNDPALIPRGFDVRTPFREPAWVDFMLRVPRELRADRGFYREIAARSDPELFAIPTKNAHGVARGAPAWRVLAARARHKAVRTLRTRFPGRFGRVDPGANYADFDAELRAPTPLCAVVDDALERLAASGRVDWLDLGALRARHAAGRANHGLALVLLACLEPNLAAAGEPEALTGPAGAPAAGRSREDGVGPIRGG